MMVIAIDFDGTCVTHEFPNVGRDIGAAPVLKRLVDAGHQLILYTMRSDSSDKDGLSGGEERFLTDAVYWFMERDIPLYGIQTNPTQKDWTTSPKCYAQLYIDDAALGAPIKRDKDPEIEDSRPYIDWAAVEMILEADGLLPFLFE